MSLLILFAPTGKLLSYIKRHERFWFAAAGDIVDA